jgi:hypothetical protein
MVNGHDEMNEWNQSITVFDDGCEIVEFRGIGSWAAVTTRVS